MARRSPRHAPRPRIAARLAKPERGAFPSREEILAFVAMHGGAADKRDIARHFGLSGGARIALKHILRDLADEGLVEKKRRRFHEPGALPSVLLADVTGRDADGELIARPAEWDDETEPAPAIVIPIPAERRPGDPVPGVGDRVLLRIADPVEDEPPSGRVIKILARKPRDLLGVFRRAADGSGRLVPTDKKSQGREIPIAPGEDGGAQEGDLVAVTLLREGRFAAPRARVRERLGSLATEKAVSLVAIHAHGIPHTFSRAALAEAEAAKPVSMRGREDLRALPLITIDPADAKDHDDAVHAEPDPDSANPGGYVVTVAIADVAAYVRPGSALDREAMERGNSVYFPDRVVPMLPEKLSNDLCSLRPGEDRPALAVRMVLGADGRKRAHGFHRIMMRSAAKLAYPQAQAAIDGAPDDTTRPLLEGVLRPLWAAYALARSARDAREPLDLDLPERKLVLDANGHVTKVIVPERLEAHRLIEEFMILANVAAAETLEKARVPLIWRVHDEPSLEKMRALGEVLASVDIKLPKAGALRPALFNHILARVKDTDHAPLVNEIVLRSQAQAEYVAENYGHFGLNLRRYAHFTSPIRRYADLIVHRGLIAAHKFGADGLPEGTAPEHLAEIAARVSVAERRAMAAERETADRLIAHFLADRIGATFEGRVAGVTKSGLFVKLDETGADGFVPASTLGREYFAYDEAAHALVGRDSGETFRLGGRVTVKLVEALPVAGALRFEVLSGGTSSRPLPKRGGRAKSSSKGSETRTRPRSRSR